MTWIQDNLKIVLAVVVVLMCAGSYVGGCSRGEQSGYADGYVKGGDDAKCDGGTHARPWTKPNK